MAEPTERFQSILVVDGDVIVRHAIAAYLRECDYQVIEAASTDEAVKALSDDTLAVDAILCDAEAPGTRNAFQLRAWMREQPNRLRVQIAMAGNIEAAAKKAAEFCEKGPYMARPYDPQSVVEYIRRLLGGSR